MRFIIVTALLPAALLSVTLSCDMTSPAPDLVERSDPDHRTQTGTLWAPFLEWSVPNPSYDGNPYDVIATVTFVHSGSGEVRETQMFYAGGNEWRFRFTGTRTGEWTFESTSEDPDLGGQLGRVLIEPNPDPSIEGFLQADGNRFAVQVGEGGEVRPRLYNVYMNAAHAGSLGDYSLEARTLRSQVDQLLNEAQAHVFDAVFVAVNNNWFDFGSSSHLDHDSENPDPDAFVVLEELITRAHARGLSVHIWKWGDEERHWTPVGVGGINGVPDRRLQRYIAARLGPLPGWTMSYGFDLDEWVAPEEVRSWAEYMGAHFGWPHLLMARESGQDRVHPSETFSLGDRKLDVFSSDQRPEADFFQWTKGLLTEAEGRPLLYERRFLHTRDRFWDMDTTRRALWQFTLGGGAGAIWGILWGNGDPYPRPQELGTHGQFWKGRFLSEMEPTSRSAGSYTISTRGGTHFVLYREDASTLRLDLTRMEGAKPAVAVDTRRPYAEIPIGTLDPGDHLWRAPHRSDWAVAVGTFPHR